MSIEPTAGTPPSASTYDATERDFETTVLQKSFEVPVLVDFWAPWCQPCLTLSPTLEKLAAESEGRFVVAKINVDENQALAQALQIRSIPAVKLIVDGQLRDEFMGALPEPQLREFLEHNLPSESEREAKAGIGELRSGHGEEAEAKFREILTSDPNNNRALVGLGLILVDRGDLDEARQLMERAVEEDDIRRELAQLRGKVFLHENAGPAEELRAKLAQDPNDLEAKFALACTDAVEGRHTDALEAFLEIVRTDRKFREDAGRKGMVATFDILPPESELADTYRGKLSSILFS